MSLRRRLLLGILLISAIGLIGVSLATNRLLKHALVAEKDTQLRSIATRVLEGRRTRPPGGTPQTANPEGPTGFFQASYDAEGNQVVLNPSLADVGGGLRNEFDVLKAPINRAFTAPSLLEHNQYRVIVREFVPGVTMNGTPVAYFVSGIDLGDVEHTLARLRQFEAVVIGVALALMALFAWFVVRTGLRPLHDMTATAGAIADGDLSARVDTGHPQTEVGRLGIAFNTMIGRIEGAFAERTRSEDKLRRFVADASHELRTPLTSIRGYSELLRAGVIPPGEETRSALGRIESEATRMGVLVDDLLLLARLDQGRPLDHKAMDLANLVANAVDDARVSDPERTWSVTLPEFAPVRGDEHRLRQVIGNLLTNARTHTPAGTPVEVSVVVADGSAELRVADHGAGVPEGEEKRIFERFARLDDSRQRASGGTGLGLAIVNAIAWSHQGTVGVGPTPGGGATFWLRLPLASPTSTAAESDQTLTPPGVADFVPPLPQAVAVPTPPSLLVPPVDRAR